MRFGLSYIGLSLAAPLVAAEGQAGLVGEAGRRAGSAVLIKDGRNDTHLC